MDLNPLVAQVNTLSVDDRLELMHAIWDSLEAEQAQLELSEAQKRELDRRLAAHAAAPENVIPWEEAKARSLARGTPRAGWAAALGVTAFPQPAQEGWGNRAK